MLKSSSSTPPEKTEITAEDIANSSDKSEFYGATVTGYTCPNEEGVEAWKLFYADENNIYLITSSYIESQFLPDGRNGSKLICGSRANNDLDHCYVMSMENVVSDYSGSSDITDVRIKALNNEYFSKGYTSTNVNMKAVAFMLDTNVWSSFAGSMADFAVGGPSIELLLKSYSEKYQVDYGIVFRENDDRGPFLIRDKSDLTGTAMIENWLNSSDSLYCTTKGVASAMWISSQNPYGFKEEEFRYLYNVSYNGTVRNRQIEARSRVWI